MFILDPNDPDFEKKMHRRYRWAAYSGVLAPIIMVVAFILLSLDVAQHRAQNDVLIKRLSVCLAKRR